jgi:hypothetical protein
MLSDDFARALRARTAVVAPTSDWRPRLFDPCVASARAELNQLLNASSTFVHDTLRDQLIELLQGREPALTLSERECERRVQAHLAGRALHEYGTWCFYPWSRRLVHVLPKDEFREVRSDRNRYKITREEQTRLRDFQIGVVGLSVGNAAALTCALEGVGGRFRLADFDQLSLSNLNRLRAGVHDLGVDKTLIAARQMLELDPYLDIELFSRGLTPDNLDDFLLGDRPIDLLVEECDDLYVKIMVRERARAHRIPVIMDTSDRGLFDVERFDSEPSRAILHGLLGEVNASELHGLETRDKVPYVLAILGGQRMSTRMAASLPEVKESIGSWPQLASGVALGGALVADAARRILLGQHRESGRYYVDIESIVRDGAGELRDGAPARASIEIAPEARGNPALPPEPAAQRVTPEAVRWLVAHGTLAPTAHNAQPWRFRFRDGVLTGEHDDAHDMPTLDYGQGATWVGFGAFLENLDLAAAAIGLRAQVQTFPDARQRATVFEARFAAAPVERDELWPWLARRVTNRRRDERMALPAGSAAALSAAVERFGVRLQLASAPEQLDTLAGLIAGCDRLTSFNRAIHHETMSGMRWTRDEVERTRDGLDVQTMELSAADRAGLELLSHWPTMDALAQLGGGRALEDLPRKAVASASAIGLLTIEGFGPEQYIVAGRALQRLWLTATMHGLALQPMTSLPYLFARLERGGGEGLSRAEQEVLSALRARYRAIFTVPAGHGEPLLFRLCLAGPPSARALRRRLDQVLTIA